ncbi:MAG: hypothetical protein JJU29_12740 [Verrucomicrobia bacterium]|nr:hypothetical protein [Verrucomicrobiota bacterium]MCH8512636.1 hypothetical protein [Kiritimatiellia bacterium]
MSKRKVRHVHARNDEWIRVHRDRPRSSGGDDGCATIIGVAMIFMLLGSCFGF